jgi:hypothetical protein
MSFLETIAGVLLPTLQGLETGAAVDLLDKMHTHSADDHKATVQSLYPGLLRLRMFADQTSTKYDNVAVDGLIVAIQQSAAKYNVSLPS